MVFTINIVILLLHESCHFLVGMIILLQLPKVSCLHSKAFHKFVLWNNTSYHLDQKQKKEEK